MKHEIDINGLLVQFDKMTNLDLSKGLQNACILVENEARKNAPANTGELRRSITHRLKSDTVGVVGTNLSYAPYVEYGTGIFSSQGNGRQDPWSYQDAKGQWHTTSGMKPQPFLHPALENNIEQIKQQIGKEIIKELMKND